MGRRDHLYLPEEPECPCDNCPLSTKDGGCNSSYGTCVEFCEWAGVKPNVKISTLVLLNER